MATMALTGRLVTAVHGAHAAGCSSEAAQAPGVERIFVHPAIKAQLCRGAGPEDRGWLERIRPWWGHDAHFHGRLSCPVDDAGFEAQTLVPPGDGCDETLAWWFTDEARAPAAPVDLGDARTLADLPRACAGLVAR